MIYLMFLWVDIVKAWWQSAMLFIFVFSWIFLSFSFVLILVWIHTGSALLDGGSLFVFFPIAIAQGARSRFESETCHLPCDRQAVALTIEARHTYFYLFYLYHKFRHSYRHSHRGPFYVSSKLSAH